MCIKTIKLKMTRFFKSKKGEIVDTIIIIPLWILILVFISSKMSVMQSLQDNESAMQIVSRYVALAETPNDAINNVKEYLSARKDAENFNLTIDGNTQEYFGINNIKQATYEDAINGTTTKINDGSDSFSSFITNHWGNHLILEVELYRKTSFYNGALSFKVNMFDGTYETLSVATPYVRTTSVLIVIGGD